MISNLAAAVLDSVEVAAPASEKQPAASVASGGESALRRPDPTPPRLPAFPGSEARALALELGVTSSFADLLLRRGHTDIAQTRRFLDPRLAHLTLPEKMADRDAAAERLAAAARKHERVCVFGDYDCDGMTSAAVMTEILAALGADPVAMVASRYDGGYGLSAAALERVFASGATLLVTCDCGSSDHESLERARARGLDAIVIDHHLVPPEPLPVLAFLNPHRPECGFPYKGLASCGLALSLCAAVRAQLGANVDLRSVLDLVAIGTIADVAPLDGDNRALVRAGLRALSEAKRPGVRALLELARIDAGCPLTGEDVAFRIAPRLNAPGRLGSPEPALRLLLSRSSDEARGLAAEIEQISTERRSLSERMLKEAVAEVEERGFAEDAAIVVGREGWSQGIVGIVAARLADRYGKPAIVVGFDGNHGRGSVRGPEGSRLYTALGAAQAALTRYGGHQAAAGLELELGKLDELRELFDRACGSGGAAEAANDIDASSAEPTLLRFDPSDDPYRLLVDLSQLEPCGEKNPTPRVAVEANLLSAREVRGGHLKLELELERGRRLAGFAPGLGERASSVGSRVLVVGKLRPDRWRGGTAVEIRVEGLY